MRTTRLPTRRRGLTMIELMVVIGIIIILISMAFPLIGAMRRSAARAQVQQQINTLQAAIDQYFNDYRAYPGPLSDETVLANAGRPAGVGASGRIPMSENLVLGLMGGLQLGPDNWSFNPARLGLGAINVSPTQPSPPKSYLAPTLGKSMLYAGGGPFRDETGRGSGDTAVPEFIDKFENPLPILYLRARPGAKGIVSDGSADGGALYQYDIRQVSPYTASDIALKPGQAHRLRNLAEAMAYLRQPESPANNAAGQPRHRNRYILISAGIDRTYGTEDDITSFGSP
jgi:type II secretory pathway pseudopilin PulG